MTLDPTIYSDSAHRTTWDAIVVGAGPAGSFAARELARAGASVLLVDKQSFPRFKVCGGCLNGRTLSLLDSAGIGELPTKLGGVPLARFELRNGGTPLSMALPSGVAVSREIFDTALVREAIQSGAHFLSGQRATLGGVSKGTRRVRLLPSACELSTRVVVAADGLAGRFLARHEARRASSPPGSRLGVGTVFSAEAATGAYPAGTLTMAVGKVGYAGVTRVERDRMSIAAALDRTALAGQAPARVVERLLAECGLPSLGLGRATWRGTPPLTRRAQTLALERVFVLGDSAGYIEPFTGEGISWSLESAGHLTPLALSAADRWRPDLATKWQALYREKVARRQRWCRFAAWGLRRPRLVRVATAAVRRAPSLAAPLVQHLNAAPAVGAR